LLKGEWSGDLLFGAHSVSAGGPVFVRVKNWLSRIDDSLSHRFFSVIVSLKASRIGGWLNSGSDLTEEFPSRDAIADRFSKSKFCFSGADDVSVGVGGFCWTRWH
jgi:hypothetical protein